MILIVSATSSEVKPLLTNRCVHEGGVATIELGNNKRADLLVTGVGAVPTTYHLLKALLNKSYSLVINVGIAGSYSSEFGLGDVVVIEQDLFADYGVDNNEDFLSLFDLDLAKPNEKPYLNGAMVCSNGVIPIAYGHLPRVKGVTVATASGSERGINEMLRRFAPDIETMESAAVFYTCLMANIPFFCIRGISNMVEPRNTKAWNMPLAIENVCNAVKNLMEDL